MQKNQIRGKLYYIKDSTVDEPTRQSESANKENKQ